MHPSDNFPCIFSQMWGMVLSTVAQVVTVGSLLLCSATGWLPEARGSGRGLGLGQPTLGRSEILNPELLLSEVQREETLLQTSPSHLCSVSNKTL